MRTALALGIATLLGLIACAGVGVGLRSTSECHDVFGACVLYAPDAPASVRGHMVAAFLAAAEHWGDKPDAIAGWTVVVHGYGPNPFNRGFLWGLTNPETKRVDVWLERPTCPELVVVHEWGHAASLAAGSEGRPHLPNVPDDVRFDDNLILITLAGHEGC